MTAVALIGRTVRMLRDGLTRIAPPGGRCRAAIGGLYDLLAGLHPRNVPGWYSLFPRRFPLLTAGFDRAALARLKIPFDDVPRTTATAAVVDLLLDRPDLHRRFPQALRLGVEGHFARFLLGEESHREGIPRADAERMVDALRSRPGDRVRLRFDVHDVKARLRSRFPLGLTPVEAPSLVLCLLRQGDRLSIDECLWFLIEVMEDPACGLAESFLRHPLWQRKVPHGLTRFGWDELKAWVAKRYNVAGDWLAHAERPDLLSPVEELHWLTVARPELRLRFPDVVGNPATARALAQHLRGRNEIDSAWLRRLLAEPHRPSINVLAHFRYPSGLRTAAINTTIALESAGRRSAKRDVPVGMTTDLPGRTGFLDLHPWPVTLVCLAPEPLAENAYPRAGLVMRDGFRIGLWYWELERVPRRWRRHARWLHELWAPTRFIGDALRKVMPMPVVDMLAGMRMPPVVEMPRTALGLPENLFLFLFVFDMASTFARKNPLAVVEAFRRAFPRRDAAALAIKVTRGSHDPAGLKKLREACGQVGAILIDEMLPEDGLFGLLNSCDAYVSLHRSEGYGLTMAEAMALGKPVIATGYSGNLDFMNERNSLLVPYEMVPVRSTSRIYRRGFSWAEPSVDAAAEMMRKLFEQPDLGRRLGEQARRDVHATLSLEAAGRRMADRLAELEHAGRFKAVA